MSGKVPLILETLKNRIIQKQTIVQQSDGQLFEVDFNWEKPAKLEDIGNFNRITGWEIPEDYKTFLLLHNGASLFESSGGAFILHPLKEVLSYYNDYETYYQNAYPPHWYQIGTYLGSGEYMYIDSNRVKQGRTDYIVMNDSGNIIRTKVNFEEWLDRFIVCQGDHFWMWEYNDSFSK